MTGAGTHPRGSGTTASGTGSVVHHPISADPGLAQRAREWFDDPHRVVVAPRPAATVMIVRDGVGGPEVFVQQRVAAMAFAPSTVVFPGGGVDPGDHSLDPATLGLAELAGAMGVTAEAAAIALPRSRTRTIACSALMTPAPAAAAISPTL